MKQTPPENRSPVQEQSTTASLPLCYAVVPAAGTARRMGLGRNKVFLELEGSPPHGLSNVRPPQQSESQQPFSRPVLFYTVAALLRSGVCQGAVMVVGEAELEAASAIAEGLKAFFPEADLVVAAGGPTRQDSVRLGLRALELRKPEWVMIHDGARPFCRPERIREVCTAARKVGAAILATPARQSLKQSVDGKLIERTIPRAEIWEAQTPQVFPYGDIVEAHRAAVNDGVSGTDDSELYERMGRTVALVEGEESNIKITTQLDLTISRTLFELHWGEEAELSRRF